MKNSKSINMLLLLLMLAIVFCAYSLGYSRFNSKAKTLKAQNDVISKRIEDLQGKIALRSVYEEGIKASAETEEQIKSKYAAGNTPEKSTMLVVGLEKAAGMTINSVSFTTDECIYNSSEVNEEDRPVTSAYRQQLIVNYSTDYDGLKKAVDYINGQSERMNVDNFTASYDIETGNLSGSLVIDLYSLSSEGREYKEPVIGGISIGTDNIFGQ